MRINHNISSMITESALYRVDHDLSRSLERLSTGLRINRSADDAAGLSVSEQMRTQIAGMRQSRLNATDGISLLQIAEGSANEISAMLQRMRELAIQSTNDTLTTTERSYTNQEYQAMLSEIDRIVGTVQYNTQTLLDGKSSSFGAATSAASVLHIGPNAKTWDRITIAMTGSSSGALKIRGTSVSNATRSESAILSLDVAINSVNKFRSDLGAYINRLEHAINNLDNQVHNTQAAEASIRDADFAAETSRFTRNQIMMESATAMLSQAHTIPENVLVLLK